ncbi:MAG: YlbF family regulator [Candidatus Improbicoccus pseudotrichonymphae]|uniref:YlbF family regulator n=1 Tax=Candidatus Improbicoccus pseudotrichonymphae TaxID=3033792 RepID=A0AA48HUQ8_9FIRM|nr:MAG: YlbF family regulator [Candidatus Improbicoccus pseudotrichonymphae]
MKVIRKEKDVYIKKAMELANEIKSGSDYKNYVKMKEKYESDERMKKLNENFEIEKDKLNEEMSSDKPDSLKIKTISENLRAIYLEINTNKTKIKYEKTKEKYGSLIGEICNIISGEVGVFSSAGCLMSCSDCSGCTDFV